MNQPREKEVLYYRVEGRRYSNGVDEFDNPLPGHRKVLVVHKYPVLKETEKGVWIGRSWEEKRFVLKSGRKRFAWPTEEEAYESFRARMRKQIRILLSQLSDAEEFLSMARSAGATNPSARDEVVEVVRSD